MSGPKLDPALHKFSSQKGVGRSITSFYGNSGASSLRSSHTPSTCMGSIDGVHLLLSNNDDDAHRDADAEGHAWLEALILSLPVCID